MSEPSERSGEETAETAPEALEGYQVFDAIVEAIKQREGARVIVFDQPVFSVMSWESSPGGGSMRHKGTRFHEAIVCPWNEGSLVIAVAGPAGSGYDAELAQVPFAEDVSEVPDERLMELLRERLERLGPSGIARPHSLAAVDRSGDFLAMPNSRGHQIFDQIQDESLVVEGPKHSDSLMESIWNPSPLKVRGGLYSPRLVEVFTEAIFAPESADSTAS